MQEDLEVTGISRSGRVRKKSSKLMDFESPDDIDTRFRKQIPMKTYAGFRSEDPPDYQVQVTPPPPPQARHVDEAGTASGSESDYYENNAENAESMESDSSGSEEGNPRTPANSLYMMEKSSKKKLIVKDGRVVGRAKAQRKDKGKTRITAYMMWAREARNEILRKHPEMDFSAISKRLGEMWSNVTYNERHLWKRKAKRFAMQKEQGNQPSTTKIISNPVVRVGTGTGQVGRPPSQRTLAARQQAQAEALASPHQQAVVPASTNNWQASGGGGSGGGAANSGGSGGGGGAGGHMYRVTGCGALDVAAHLRLLGESLAIIGSRLQEHEGQIAVSGSVSVLLDTLLCSLAPLLCVARAVPAIAPPQRLLLDTLHNVAYIMPGL